MRFEKWVFDRVIEGSNLAYLTLPAVVSMLMFSYWNLLKPNIKIYRRQIFKNVKKLNFVRSKT